VITALKRAGRAVAGALPVVLLVRLGLPALAALVLLGVLVLGVACWIINSGDRSDRVARMMLARQGNASCLTSKPAPRPVPASRPRRRRPARRR
jgi:hypothetical protein